MQQYNKTIQKMLNFDDVTKENKRTLSTWATNSQPSIQNINNRRLWIRKKNSLYAKDPYEAKYQFLINK